MMINEIYGGKYQFIRMLGQGTTAQVYLARDIQNGVYYAVKVSDEKELLWQEEALLRRAPEGVFPEAVAYFEEGNGETQKSFLVMEYLTGGTLRDALDKQGKYGAKEAVQIVQEILACLQHLHEMRQPVIYRDIKPANIMFDQSGKVRLIDAGSGVQGKYRVGTYGYAAPEQFWSGVKPDPSCDIYAVGKLLAYLVTGKNPEEPPYDVLEYCSKDRSITPSLFQVLQRCLAADSMGRYASAEEFSRELERAYRLSQKKKLAIFAKKQKITYEKCIWKSGMQRIF